MVPVPERVVSVVVVLRSVAVVPVVPLPAAVLPEPMVLPEPVALLPEPVVPAPAPIVLLEPAAGAVVLAPGLAGPEVELLPAPMEPLSVAPPVPGVRASELGPAAAVPEALLPAELPELWAMAIPPKAMAAAAASAVRVFLVVMSSLLKLKTGTGFR